MFVPRGQRGVAVFVQARRIFPAPAYLGEDARQPGDGLHLAKLIRPARVRHRSRGACDERRQEPRFNHDGRPREARFTAVFRGARRARTPDRLACT